jgi:hypothetical protein
MKIIDQLVRPAGKWGDVVTLPNHGGFAWFYSVDGAAVCEINGAEAFREPVATDFLRFTRGRALPSLACLGQGAGDINVLAEASGVVVDGIAFGQNPVAFGPGGQPYVVRDPGHFTIGPGPELFPMPHTSQGIRFIREDGAVVLGDDTMHGVIGGHQFWQYQTRGTITAGQAGTNVGLAVLNGDDYLVISRPGDPLGVQFAVSTDGTRLAVCAWTVNGAEFWLIDLLAESEPVPVPQPTPAHVPVPVPGPVSPPQPEHDPMPNHLDTVKAIRSKYGTPLGARHWEFLVEVAHATGAKLFRKDGGDRIIIPSLGVGVSQDVVIIAPEWIDILKDGEGAAVPAWDAHPNAGEPEKWIDVSGVALPGAPVPPPVPAVPPPSGSLEARVARLEAQIAKLRAALE